MLPGVGSHGELGRRAAARLNAYEWLCAPAYVGQKRGMRKESHTRDRSEEEGTIAAWVFRERIAEGVARTTKGVYERFVENATNRKTPAQKTRYILSR